MAVCGFGTSATHLTIQAEDWTRQQQTSNSKEHAGSIGDYVDFGGEFSWIEWDNVVAPAGRYELEFRYANGGEDSRPADIIINDELVAEVAFDPTTSNGQNLRWKKWRNVKSTPVPLREGRNVIRVAASTDAGGPNIDQMEIRPLPITSAGQHGAENDTSDQALNQNMPSSSPQTQPPTTTNPDENWHTLRPRPTPSGSRFTIALYPDLQKLTRDNNEDDGLDNTTKWIISKKNQFNILMVLAVGDMVTVAKTCDQQSRWDRVLRNVHHLDEAGIPFIPTCGNHDGCYKRYGSPADYVAQFTNDHSCGRKPYDVSKRNPFYAGEFNGVSNRGFQNSWYKFEKEGKKFILMSLRYANTKELETEWKRHTNPILAQHRDHYGIILTHEAHDVHRKYACQNPNVKLIIQGHRHGGRQRELIKCGNNGHQIQRFIFAFRHDVDRFVQEAAAARFFTFDLANSRIEMKTYSTHESKWLGEKTACTDSAVGGRHCDEYSWEHHFS